MKYLNIFFVSSILCLLATLGTFCIARPGIFVHWAQNNYRRSRLIQAYPFSNLVFRPWFPTYLRFMGLVVWAFVLLSVMVLTGHGF